MTVPQSKSAEMNLTEKYDCIYVVCKTYNDLIAKEKWEREHFADLEDYLQKNRNDIVKYELVSEIYKKFRNNEFNIEDIKNLIQKKRQEETCFSISCNRCSSNCRHCNI